MLAKGSLTDILFLERMVELVPRYEPGPTSTLVWTF